MSMNRRDFFKRTGQAAIATVAAGSLAGCSLATFSASEKPPTRRSSQRLTLEQLKKWEQLRYGMFIHFGISTFRTRSYPPGQTPMSVYTPEKVDVDQWISVVRDAGMKYAVLTSKSANGHCLWPSEHTDYTVANSGNKNDIVEKFMEACQKRKIMPGIYYNSSDNHHRFGSQTRQQAKRKFMKSFPKTQQGDLPPYTTSVYQTFMTAQITELLKRYGPIGEMWIDLPGELGRGYRTFLYHHITQLQPDIYIMMNNGVDDSTKYDYHYAFPSDLLAIERGLPPESGYQKWRTIEGKEYYIPGEVCDTIGKHWYYRPPDPPRSDQTLLGILEACRDRGVNLLLDVPPSKKGVIPLEYVNALMRLRKNAKL